MTIVGNKVINGIYLYYLLLLVIYLYYHITILLNTSIICKTLLCDYNKKNNYFVPIYALKRGTCGNMVITAFLCNRNLLSNKIYCGNIANCGGTK